jgi:hypothetical protein
MALALLAVVHEHADSVVVLRIVFSICLVMHLLLVALWNV